MDKKSGRVRKVIVRDVSSFTDTLARYLCKEGVSYLQIDNEFHLSNVIFQFHDIADYESFKDEPWFSLVEDKIITFDIHTIASVRPEIKGFEEGLVGALTIADTDDCFLEYENTGREIKAPVYTKQMMRRDNRMMKQRFKNNISNGRINRHFY